ncbi:DNA polymerase Y family protein [Brevundimonas sp.]|uniref:Y-family DNA polymerase n=1 Tax=Brevundimonas sp. TaxID=1871086 RepID=UPI002489158F|nr:DNA polymerase Y family protein [Brevundimonas sp.]MDI1280898.1 DNA polymerase Y family protein [Brevundimonas sp.]
MRRIVSVWLIDWPVTVRARSAGRLSPPDPSLDPAMPLALIRKTARGAMIHALNPAARAAGLRRGQTQADALAMIPTLACHPADPEADRRALEGLALWAERWSPAVSVSASADGLDGICLDMTGAAHLFGGVAALPERIGARLAEAGITARVAVAPTIGAAWALARHGDPERRTLSVDDDSLRDSLAGLPVEALRIGADVVAEARRFGLKRIGDLYPMPRAGLARRFRDGDGVDLVRRLDQALGFCAEALVPVRAPPRYRVWEAHAEPLTDTDGIAARLPGLAADLAAALNRDSQGARTLTLNGFRTDGTVSGLSVRMGRADRDPVVWLRLFRERGLERIDPGFGIDALMLSADLTEPITDRQGEMEAQVVDDRAAALTPLIDRLSARLGERQVLRPEPVDSWIPERAERLRPALGTLPSLPDTGDGRRRPILMFDPPEPIEALAELPDGAPARFTWRRVSRRVRRADGPERLSPEWWRPRPDDRQARTRDYYCVEDDGGHRYWLFREGLYGREYAGHDDERAPSWWMHGMFA